MPFRGLKCFEKFFGRRLRSPRLEESLREPLQAGEVRELACEAIRNIEEESATLAALPLPLASREIVENVRRSLRALDNSVQSCSSRARPSYSSPWASVPEGEQKEWRQMDVSRSLLLHTQVCMVEDDEEQEDEEGGVAPLPRVARLFVSSRGLSLQSEAGLAKPTVGSCGSTTARKVPAALGREHLWGDIVMLRRCSNQSIAGAMHHVELCFEKRKCMRLSLGSAWQAASLEDAWGWFSCHSNMEIDAEGGNDDENLHTFFSFGDEEESSVSGLEHERFPNLGASSSAGCRFASASSPCREIVDRHIPTSQPLFQCRFSTTSLPAVVAAFESNEDWLIHHFVREALGAQELTGSGWEDVDGRAGTKVRSMAFQMPLPKDVPAPVRRLVRVPDFASVTSTYCMHSTIPGELTVVQWSHSAGVPFAGNLKVEDILHFRQCPDGSVALRKWTHSIWQRGTPSVIRWFVDSRVMREALAIMDRFVETVADYSRRSFIATSTGGSFSKLDIPTASSQGVEVDGGTGGDVGSPSVKQSLSS